VTTIPCAERFSARRSPSVSSSDCLPGEDIEASHAGGVGPGPREPMRNSSISYPPEGLSPTSLFSCNLASCQGFGGTLRAPVTAGTNYEDFITFETEAGPVTPTGHMVLVYGTHPVRSSKMLACWECEAATNQPRTVSPPTPYGHIGPLALCPSCYQMYYLPLIPEAHAERTSPTPSSPKRATPRDRLSDH
jgi:hypothetical protein